MQWYGKLGNASEANQSVVPMPDPLSGETGAEGVVVSDRIYCRELHGRVRHIRLPFMRSRTWAPRTVCGRLVGPGWKNLRDDELIDESLCKTCVQRVESQERMDDMMLRILSCPTP